MTARIVVTTHRADEDIEAVLDGYATCGSESAALAFIDALDDAQKLIAEFPQVGSTRLAAEVDMPHVRTLALRRFPDLVFYTDDTDSVRIHRVLHTSRDIPASLQDK